MYIRIYALKTTKGDINSEGKFLADFKYVVFDNSFVPPFEVVQKMALEGINIVHSDLTDDHQNHALTLISKLLFFGFFFCKKKKPEKNFEERSARLYKHLYLLFLSGK